MILSTLGVEVPLSELAATLSLVLYLPNLSASDAHFFSFLQFGLSHFPPLQALLPLGLLLLTFCFLGFLPLLPLCSYLLSLWLFSLPSHFSFLISLVSFLSFNLASHLPSSPLCLLYSPHSHLPFFAAFLLGLCPIPLRPPFPKPRTPALRGRTQRTRAHKLAAGRDCSGQTLRNGCPEHSVVVVLELS